MPRHGPELAAEAARIYVEEALTDYGAAKRRAAERLGLSSRGGLPDNARVEAEVIAYQRLFGGAAYAARLQQLRRTAVQAMQLLAAFAPRLTGAVVSGAISSAHRVQLHAFPDKAELVDVFLVDRGFKITESERDYRYGNGRVESIPVVGFMADAVGVDVALFAPGDERQSPIAPASGRAAPRLTFAEAQALAQQSVETL